MTASLPAWIVSMPCAHRGLHDLANGVPENTMSAFDAACANGYPIELDVQRLGDGTVVVFHDYSLHRACGIDRRLSDVGWDDIADLRVFGSDQGIPRLRDVLAAVADRVPLLVEIKKGERDTGIETAVWRLLSRYEGDFAVQSFRPSVVQWFRARAPGAPVGQIAGPLSDGRVSFSKRIVSRWLLSVSVARPDFINYDLRALPFPWLEGLRHLTSIPVICWTVRTPADQEKAERFGLNYVFENVRP
ncbi:MAG: glycerophosphodiester phosphodiesterase family protein [Polyangiales bacterium]